MSCAGCACPKYLLGNREVQTDNAILVEANPARSQWFSHNRTKSGKEE
jgi:hypothetical protein